MPTGTSALFENTGIVAMHSANTPGWNPDAAVADTYRSSVFFHSSRFGSFNHSHAAQNSFELTVNGVNLLINSGYYVNYDTDYQKLAVRATRYKNALTFDNGIGQAEPTDNSTVPGKPLDTMLTSGKLTNYYQNGAWTIATGNAKNAYRALSADKLSWTPLLTNAIRTVAYNRVDKVLVIYDYATSNVARQWELNFHSTGGYTDKNYNMITLNAKDLKAKACMAIVNLEGTFDTWAGFGEEPPITGTDPHDQQFHARYRSKYKTKELAAMTIIRENCAGGSRPAKVTDPATNPTRLQIQMADGSILYFDKDKVELPN
jgi:hypothetical protein